MIVLIKHMKTQQKTIKKLLKILNKYDAKKSDNNDWQEIQSAITKSVYKSEPITLLQFTCSTINPTFLFSQKSPEKYISLNPVGNNLEPDLPTLEKMLYQLNMVYPTQVIILIGNTDPYYIYSEGGTLYPNITTSQLLEKYNLRWKLYKKNLASWVKKQYPRLPFNVISWYELETRTINSPEISFEQEFQNLLPSIENYFTKKKFDWELNKLQNAFGPGKYFYNIDRPKDTVLKRWIKRKFTEYMLQGFWLKILFPNGILLQNEKPSDLRSSMYQPLLQKMNLEKLPILYPYGIDNSGFQ